MAFGEPTAGPMINGTGTGFSGAARAEVSPAPGVPVDFGNKVCRRLLH